LKFQGRWYDSPPALAKGEGKARTPALIYVMARLCRTSMMPTTDQPELAMYLRRTAKIAALCLLPWTHSVQADLPFGPAGVPQATVTRDSVFDTNGLNNFFPSVLTLDNATLRITNSTGTPGFANFPSLVAIGAAGIAMDAPGGSTSGLIFAAGITRSGAATLSLIPGSSGSLGGAVRLSLGPTPLLNNGMTAPWITINNGGKYDFATYGPTGFATATYTRTVVDIPTQGGGFSPPSPNDVVSLHGSNTYFGGGADMYALRLDSGSSVSGPVGPILRGGSILSVNGGGLIMNGASIRASFLSFGNVEGVVTTTGYNVIDASVLATGGLTFAGNGTTALLDGASVTGPFTLNSGTVELHTPNAIATASNVTLGSAATNPAVLLASGIQKFAALNGGGTVNLVNDAVLTIGDPLSVTGVFGGVLTVNGSLLIQGVQTLNGQATATSTTAGGTLTVGDAGHPAATLAGPVLVSPAGTFGGTGTVTGSVSNQGTVIAGAGNTAASFRVNGDYTQAKNGTLRIVLDPAGTGRLTVSGAANLSGTLMLAPNANPALYVPGSRYTVVSAASLTGQFDNVIPNLLVTVTPTYDAANAFVTLGQVSLASVAQTATQLALAPALDALFASAFGPSGNPSIQQLYAAAISMSAAELQDLLTRSRGEGYGQSGTVLTNAIHAFTDSVQGQIAGLHGSLTLVETDGSQRVQLASLDPNASVLPDAEKKWGLLADRLRRLDVDCCLGWRARRARHAGRWRDRCRLSSGAGRADRPDHWLWQHQLHDECHWRQRASVALSVRHLWRDDVWSAVRRWPGWRRLRRGDDDARSFGAWSGRVGQRQSARSAGIRSDRDGRPLRAAGRLWHYAVCWPRCQFSPPRRVQRNIGLAAGSVGCHAEHNVDPQPPGRQVEQRYDRWHSTCLRRSVDRLGARVCRCGASGHRGFHRCSDCVVHRPRSTGGS
jgi:hypothetical protein